MWDDKVIALDYEPVQSVDPENYKNAASRKAISRLTRYCESGALVGADFRNLYNDKMLIGEISPGSKIEFRTYGSYPYYKVVPLVKARYVSYLDYPVLMTMQPRLAAITGWPSMKRLLHSLVNRYPLPANVYTLDIGQLEVLCYEYLLANRLIAHLLLPIGRTLRDIDIYGIDPSGRKVAAQVTFSKSEQTILDKSSRLSKFEDAILYMLCPEEMTSLDCANITFIGIETVFDYFHGSDLLRLMLPK